MSKKTIFLAGLWREHPNLRQLLGMCPTLAITTSVLNGFAMGTAVLFVLVFSSFMVALIKRLIPHQVRIAVYTIIIATFVTIADITLKAFFPQISRALGPYVPLIVVNCIILGRAEAFASRNSVGNSVLDALGMSLGFMWGLMAIGAVREILGRGTIFGFRLGIIHFRPWIIMLLPAGAFFVLGFVIAFMNFLDRQKRLKT